MQKFIAIKDVYAREILDSRGNPTIEVEVLAEGDIVGRAAVPSGASTGQFEAVELRDQERRYNGLGVRRAAEHVNTILADCVIGDNVLEQRKIDEKLCHIDGTENNETALTTGKHGEICKVYSVDEHAMIPDVMVMSSKVWNNIEPDDQKIILQCAKDATQSHKVMWDKAIDEAVAQAKDMGVEFIYDVDKEAFRSATAGLVTEYRNKYTGVAALLDRIDEIRKGE